MRLTIRRVRPRKFVFEARLFIEVRITDVVYNASNNELVRTKTLVKNAIVQVDATLFKQWCP